MSYDPPSPLAIVRGFFGAALAVATAALLVHLVRTGEVSWRIVALLFALWTFFGLATDVLRTALVPLGRFFLDLLSGGGRAITIEDETTLLERRLGASPPPSPRQEILWSIRLAEIYREHQHDKPRADALLDRLVAKYPDSSEAQLARRFPI